MTPYEHLDKYVQHQVSKFIDPSRHDVLGRQELVST